MVVAFSVIRGLFLEFIGTLQVGTNLTDCTDRERKDKYITPFPAHGALFSLNHHHHKTTVCTNYIGSISISRRRGMHFELPKVLVNLSNQPESTRPHQNATPNHHLLISLCQTPRARPRLRLRGRRRVLSDALLQARPHLPKSAHTRLPTYAGGLAESQDSQVWRCWIRFRYS
jgi:hypothetical protein